MPRVGILVVAAFLMTAGGCVVVDKRIRPHTLTASCHPSQYWDGRQCRHKGKGQGARKHDGAPKGKAKRSKQG